jgi:hypothetical protein
LLIDRDQRFAVHLVVVVAQVGGAVGIERDAVERELERVGDAQAAADQDECDQAVGRVVPSVEVGRVFHLRHHVFGHRAGQPLAVLRVVLRIERRSRWQRWIPTVLADRGEELVQQPNVGAVHRSASELDVQVGQVPLQDRAVHVG